MLECVESSNTLRGKCTRLDDTFQDVSVLNHRFQAWLLGILAPDRSCNVESENYDAQIPGQGEFYLKYRRANCEWFKILVSPNDKTHIAHRVKIGSDSPDYVAANRDHWIMRNDIPSMASCPPLSEYSSIEASTLCSSLGRSSTTSSGAHDAPCLDDTPCLDDSDTDSAFSHIDWVGISTGSSSYFARRSNLDNNELHVDLTSQRPKRGFSGSGSDCGRSPQEVKVRRVNVPFAKPARDHSSPPQSWSS